jgi:hypothetical protein
MEHITDYCFFIMLLLLNIYCKEGMYSMFSDKLQNCSPNQFEQIFTQWHKWNRSEYKFKGK